MHFQHVSNIVNSRLGLKCLVSGECADNHTVLKGYKATPNITVNSSTGLLSLRTDFLPEYFSCTNDIYSLKLRYGYGFLESCSLIHMAKMYFFFVF